MTSYRPKERPVMFRTVNRLRSTPFFWATLTRICPLPCDPCVAGFSAAVLAVPAERLVVVLAPSEHREAENEGFLVQLRDMLVDDLLVDVILGQDYAFLRGAAFGSPSDEFGVAQVLEAFAFEIAQGEWDVHVKGEDDNGNEQG